jgi:hypothetical protein
VSARRQTGSRQIWTVAAWLALAALAATAIVFNDVSIGIGAAVAAVWALCAGFFPVSPAGRS